MDDEAPDLARYSLMSRDQARTVIYIAVLTGLRKLRWAPWRKHMTVEEVLKQSGVNAFADDLTDQLLQNKVLLQGPAAAQASIGGWEKRP